MDLKEIYQAVNKRINEVDFSLLWHGFKPLKFAVYNDEDCFFNGGYIDKTDQFLANTAIKYNGEFIAIWYLGDETIDYDILATKIIHEMFHGFQFSHHESRFPNELEALRDYRYNLNNLSLKMEENKLINGLIDRFNHDAFEKLLKLRKYRQSQYRYEYLYEASIEQIEGSALYVELEALKQLSRTKFKAAITANMENIVQPKNLIPMRIVSYSIGALLLYVIKKHTDIEVDQFGDETFAETMLKHTLYEEIQPKVNKAVEETLDAYHHETRAMIDATLKMNNCVLEGKFPLVGVNVYNARRLDAYLISTYFVAYKKADKDEIKQGDYLIEMDEDGDIKKLYAMKM